MKAFVITWPYISTGLRKTYNKRLEVFECTIDEEDTRYSRTGYKIKAVHYKYTYSETKGWKQRECPSIKNSCQFNTYFNLYHTANTSSKGLYTTLEAAQASKLLLLRDMEDQYKRAIRELEDTLARNIPNYAKPLNQLLDQYPDLFL